jgi:hypothetical protein
MSESNASLCKLFMIDIVGDQIRLLIRTIDSMWRWLCWG